MWRLSPVNMTGELCPERQAWDGQQKTPREVIRVRANEQLGTGRETAKRRDGNDGTEMGDVRWEA